MKGLLIFFGIVALIAAYVIISKRVIDIMDDAGCRGEFVEWFVALAPIVHTIFLIRNWSLLNRDSWVEQYKAMSDKMKNERDRRYKEKERSANISRNLLND